jgi:hypothetical protein
LKVGGGWYFDGYQRVVPFADFGKILSDTATTDIACPQQYKIIQCDNDFLL